MGRRGPSCRRTDSGEVTGDGDRPVAASPEQRLSTTALPLPEQEEREANYVRERLRFPKAAILAAQEAMRAAFGKDIRFDPIPPAEKAPRSFRVLDGKGRHLESFGVFEVGSGKWAWQEASPQS